MSAGRMIPMMVRVPKEVLEAAAALRDWMRKNAPGTRVSLADAGRVLMERGAEAMGIEIKKDGGPIMPLGSDT
jgi:hypothetical protein